MVWRIPTDKNEIFLTFDDGPVAGPTEFVLEELRKHNAKATFFCIGDNVRKHTSIFDKVVSEGHAVGNHTYNHLKGWSTSLQKYQENVSLCEEVIRESKMKFVQTSTEANHPLSTGLFRPPYGRITRSQIDTLKSKYQILMWDVLTHDYSKGVSNENCLRGSIGAVRAGSIVVFHDSLKAERNLTYVLPRFLEHFSSQGFVFKMLPHV